MSDEKTIKETAISVLGFADRLALPQKILDFCGSLPILNATLYKTISRLNLERLLVTDFGSNDFSEIPLAYLLNQLKPILEISVKKVGKCFY